MRANQVAQLVDGVLEGDGGQKITSLAPLDDAVLGQLTFLAHARHFAQLSDTQARVLITSQPLWRDSGCRRDDLTLIFVAHPMWAVARICQVLAPKQPRTSHIDSTAVVHPTATVHATATLGPHAVVSARATVGAHAQVMAQSFVGDGAQLGAHSVLHPGARVLWGCTVGERCVLHAGAVIGADGFGFAKNPRGPEHLKVPQMGCVVVGDDVEIGANSTIDRATFGATTVGDGCKIDNLVQIGHNVVLGKHCVVASQTGIAGSATLGDGVTVGAQGGIVGHLRIAAGTVLAARTGVISSLTTAGVYAGAPAMEHRAWLRMVAATRDLGGMRKRLAALTRKTPPATKAH